MKRSMVISGNFENYNPKEFAFILWLVLIVVSAAAVTAATRTMCGKHHVQQFTFDWKTFTAKLICK